MKLLPSFLSKYSIYPIKVCLNCPFRLFQRSCDGMNRWIRVIFLMIEKGAQNILSYSKRIFSVLKGKRTILYTVSKTQETSELLKAAIKNMQKLLHIFGSMYPMKNFPSQEEFNFYVVSSLEEDMPSQALIQSCINFYYLTYQTELKNSFRLGQQEGKNLSPKTKMKQRLFPELFISFLVKHTRWSCAKNEIQTASR